MVDIEYSMNNIRNITKQLVGDIRLGKLDNIDKANQRISILRTNLDNVEGLLTKYTKVYCIEMETELDFITIKNRICPSEMVDKLTPGVSEVRTSRDWEW